ncbi:hypothetical protein HanRHA438_Chr09g0395901 [Helianthus annuus]|nr:hypothetical protein HanRHA438_Chr09g0395901 [Helianthus annuus]
MSVYLLSSLSSVVSGDRRKVIGYMSNPARSNPASEFRIRLQNAIRCQLQNSNNLIYI